jgi:hypothetical protein
MRWLGPLEYVGGQLVVLLGFWFVVWIAAMIRYRPRAGLPPGIGYLWWMSAPTFVVFGVSSLRASGQLNWPVAGYLSGAVLAAGFLADVWTTPRPLIGRLVRWGTVVAVAAGFMLTILAHDTRIFTGLVGPYLPEDSSTGPPAARKIDPAARLKGARYLAGELDALRAANRDALGREPVLAALRWDVPGLLGFYSEGQPQAYALGVVLGIDRHNQYDLWRPNPIDDAQEFRGRTFLIVTSVDARIGLASAFESIDPPTEVVYPENGRKVARWVVLIGRGFKGFDPARRPGIEAGH